MLAACSCGSSARPSDAGTDGDAENDAAADADGALDADGDEPLDAGGDSRSDAGDGSALPIVDPGCTLPGCLRSTTSIGSYSKAEIEPYLESGVEIDNGYSVWRIVYRTDGRDARASITFPSPSEPSSDGYPIGVITPGTVGVADVCAVGNGVAGTGLAAFFGAYGMIGVAVDYPGLGTEGAHPYLVRTVEGRAALDAVRATIALARLTSVPTSGRAVIAGLSQGGHAAIAAAAEHSTYASELDVRAFAAAAPANVFLEQWSGGVAVAGPHMALHALLVHAWSVYYAHSGAPLFAPSIAADIPRWMDTLCTYDIAGESLQRAIPEQPAAVFAADFLSAYRAGSLGDYPAIARGFAENRLTGFRQTAPLLVYQGTADDVVLPWMTDALVAELRRAGVEIDFRSVEGGTHTDVAFSFVASRQIRADEARDWLRAHLDR